MQKKVYNHHIELITEFGNFRHMKNQFKKNKMKRKYRMRCE